MKPFYTLILRIFALCSCGKHKQTNKPLPPHPTQYTRLASTYIIFLCFLSFFIGLLYINVLSNINLSYTNIYVSNKLRMYTTYYCVCMYIYIIGWLTSFPKYLNKKKKTKCSVPTLSKPVPSPPLSNPGLNGLTTPPSAPANNRLRFLGRCEPTC